MFYKAGIDITNDRQMFNFLKNHFEYPIMNSWNRCYSVANNVKLYNLGLSGDWTTVWSLLCNGEYDALNCIVYDWQLEHRGYEVFFNGRSGGYLVLKSTDNNCHVLPECIVDYDNYEDYKEYCRDNYGSVKANHDELVYYTKLVRDFDKLCDELREYCDELSQLKYEVIEMEKAVDRFNAAYEDDLELLGFSPLVCEGGVVNISDIMTLQCLKEAFYRVADCSDDGYVIELSEDKGWAVLRKGLCRLA